VSWQKVELGDLTVKIGSGATPQGGSTSYRASGIPLVRSMNVHDGEFRPEGMAFIDELQAKELDHVTLTKDDVLLNITGASVARACLLPPQYAGGRVNQHVAIIRPKSDKLHPRYLAHCLISPAIKHALLGLAGGGATREAITKAQIQQFKIPLPPLDEQRRIASILNQADELRCKRREALDRLSTLSTSIFIGMFGNIENNAFRWAVEPLNDVVRQDTIVTYGIVQAGDEFESGVPYIRTGDIVDGEIKVDQLRRTDPAIAAKFSRSRVETNEIVMSIRATVGTTAFVPREIDGANLTQGTARISPGKRTDHHFLLAYLRSDSAQKWLQRQVKGATFREITLSRLREMPILMPPLNLQRSFAARSVEIDKLYASHRTHLAKVNALFASLQHRGFRGEL
jgi:type I restriction enzyme S subunit